jgi:ABC-type sugar transport system ATPase subunit
MLSIDPKVIIMDEPTRGVDVGAKVEIHRILRQLAAKGTGIIVISSELPELIGLCDRAIVIREGRIAGELGGRRTRRGSHHHARLGRPELFKSRKAGSKCRLGKPEKP